MLYKNHWVARVELDHPTYILFIQKFKSKNLFKKKKSNYLVLFFLSTPLKILKPNKIFLKKSPFFPLPSIEFFFQNGDLNQSFFFQLDETENQGERENKTKQKKGHALSRKWSCIRGIFHVRNNINNTQFRVPFGGLLEKKMGIARARTRVSSNFQTIISSRSLDRIVTTWKRKYEWCFPRDHLNLKNFMNEIHILT